MKNASYTISDDLRIEPGRRIDLQKDYDPGYNGNYTKKEETGEALAAGIRLLAELQDKLYAQNTYALLIVLQALDAAGKDSTIKHVMSGVNPQGSRSRVLRNPAQKNSTTIISGGIPGPCREGVTSGSSTARTTKRCW